MKMRLRNISLSLFSNFGGYSDIKQTKKHSLHVVDKAFLQLHTSSSSTTWKIGKIGKSCVIPQNCLFRVMGSIQCFDNTFYSRKRRKYLCPFPIWIFGSVSVYYLVVWHVYVVVHFSKLFVCCMLCFGTPVSCTVQPQ